MSWVWRDYTFSIKKCYYCNMKKSKDILSTVVLIFIFLIILVLVFYIFLYSGSKPDSSINSEKIEPNLPASRETLTASKKKNKERDEKKEKKIPAQKKQKSEKKPVVKTEIPPAPIPEADDKSQSLDLLRVGIDNLVAYINQTAMQQFSQDMVSGVEITDNGNRLNLYVTKAWYIIPPFQKQVMFNLVAMQYGKQACELKIRSECSNNDFPTIIFFNPQNKEVARMAANQPLQIFE